MTNPQLYLAIGVPVAFNLLGFTLITMFVNARFDTQQNYNADLFAAQNQLFTEKLFRVEQVLDARLKHLEEK